MRGRVSHQIQESIVESKYFFSIMEEIIQILALSRSYVI